MTDSSNKNSSFMNSLTMGALTIGTGIALKWLLKQNNRQKLYNAIDNVLSDAADSAKSEVGKITDAKSKMRNWVVTTIGNSDKKSDGKKSSTKKTDQE